MRQICLAEFDSEFETTSTFCAHGQIANGVEMTRASALKMLFIAGFSMVVATSASAQLSQNQNLAQLGLEPTIKVIPSPEIKEQKPAAVVPTQCVCTLQYDPVCGRVRGANEVTFSNACQARCVDAVIVRRGAC